MSHGLGIDLGTTFVAAAARRAVSNPDQGTHDLERRLGDPAPVLLGGVPFTVTALLGTLLRTVLARAVEVSAGEPDTVVLTHPATGEPVQCRALADVAESAGPTRYSTVTEPEVAEAHLGATRYFEAGEVLAVDDLGGGAFIVAVLAHVDAAAGRFLHRLDPSDARTVVAVARLRQDCTVAREALSSDMETTIPVFLPSRHMEVKLSRQEFEDLLRVPVESMPSPPGEPAPVGSV